MSTGRCAVGWGCRTRVDRSPRPEFEVMCIGGFLGRPATGSYTNSPAGLKSLRQQEDGILPRLWRNAMVEERKARAGGINHVALEVGDIEEALEFYGRLFD